MRMFKYLGAMVIVLAFSMIGVATASAAETLISLLPGTVGETFTGENEAKSVSKLQEKGGAVIECKKLSLSLAGSELIESGSTNKKDATLATGALTFSECKTLGVAANSSGDSAGTGAGGTILANVDIHLCLITKSPEVIGALISLLKDILIEAAKTPTLNVKGSFVAPIKKVGVSEFLIEAKQTAGAQVVEKCEGGTKETLLSELLSTKKAVEAGQESNTLIKFDKTKDAEEVFN